MRNRNVFHIFYKPDRSATLNSPGVVKQSQPCSDCCSRHPCVMLKRGLYDCKVQPPVTASNQGSTCIAPLSYSSKSVFCFALSWFGRQCNVIHLIKTKSLFLLKRDFTAVTLGAPVFSNYRHSFHLTLRMPFDGLGVAPGQLPLAVELRRRPKCSRLNLQVSQIF